MPNVFAAALAASSLLLAACGSSGSASSPASSTGSAAEASVLKAAAAAAASPNDATISTATQIVDSVGKVWTVAGGVVYVNGALAGTSKNVTQLVYDDNVLYQQSSSGVWLSWNGSAWVASLAPPKLSSANGTAIPSATQIVDSSGNAWTVSGGVSYKNGAPTANSAAITQLVYDNGGIYQENSAGVWSSWTGSAWVSSSGPPKSSSANGTSIPSGTQIVDNGGNVWTVTSGVVSENGALAGYSANVIKLAYDNNTIYQENAAGGYWSWTAGTWLASTALPQLSSPNGTTVSSATQLVDSSGNVWSVTGGVVDKNGALAGYSKNVTQLTYANGVISQQNAIGNWYSWTGSTWVASTDPIGAAVAPTISGSPATADAAGKAYSFVPTTTNPSGGALGFAITNMPAWASFSTVTGALTGTPTSGQAGAYANIIISASSGGLSSSLAAFTITVSGTATLSWTAPTENTNGSVLTDLAGYTIYYGTSPTAMTETVQVASPTTTSYEFANLSAGTYYFSVVAYTTTGTDSAESADTSKVIL